MKLTVQKLVIAALMIAITCVVTMFAKIPIPLGYANLGSAVIMLTVFFLGGKIGLLSAGIGSALSDLLLGYGEWILPTLIVKTIMALIFIIILYSKNKGTKVKLYSIRAISGAIIMNVWTVAGYVVAGAILYGSMAAGIGSGLGLILEAVVNIIIFFAVASVLEAAGIRKILNL